MADHPLRPATDRCLGRPLPHQLANQTQDPLLAPGLAVPGFHHKHPSLWSHAVLPFLSERYSPQRGRFPTRYSPVCHAPCGTSDLHVLGTPPAFILSQDQTLMFNLLTHNRSFDRSGYLLFVWSTPSFDKINSKAPILSIRLSKTPGFGSDHSPCGSLPAPATRTLRPPSHPVSAATSIGQRTRLQRHHEIARTFFRELRSTRFLH